MNYRRSLARAMLAAVLLVNGAVHAQDVQIGANFPLSGPQGSYGDVFMSGSNLAVEHINADKLLAGKLSINYEDSQGTPQRGVIGMNKLVNVDKVPFVLSSFTGVLKATAPIGARTKTPILNGSGIAPDLADLGPYFWSVIPLTNFEVQAMLPHLVKERKFKRFVPLYIDETVGQAGSTAISEVVISNKAPLIATHRAQLGHLHESGAPLFATQHGDLVQIAVNAWTAVNAVTAFKRLLYGCLLEQVSP